MGRIIDSLAKAKVLVIGDIMLDRYFWGQVERISPEAPVPVVQVAKKTEVLGGAGNVAANLAGLGCPVTVMATCGQDGPADRLDQLLNAQGIDHQMIIDPSRPTTTKTRVMAGKQQVLRLDEEQGHAITEETAHRLADRFENALPHCQAVVLSDYGKGLLTATDVVQRLIDIAAQHQVPVFVDPKGIDWHRYQHAFCVTPNIKELGLVAGGPAPGDESELIAMGARIRKQHELDWLLVTRGAEGMCLLGKGLDPLMVPARSREVFDVSGAGDTVIATTAAAVAAGMSMQKAIAVANLAAGVVVAKVGTQPIRALDLEIVLQQDHGRRAVDEGKLASLDMADARIAAWRRDGQRIVFTNGCFDLLHPGHISLLNQARACGDRLVVGLNTDASVKRLKGAKRPILAQQDRAAILSALASVDMVVLFNEDTPLALIEALKPDVLVKGADYRLDQVVGRSTVEAYGGRVELVKILEGYSTTTIADAMGSDAASKR